MMWIWFTSRIFFCLFIMVVASLYLYGGVEMTGFPDGRMKEWVAGWMDLWGLDVWWRW